MLETPVQEPRGRTAATVERHAHIRWIDRRGEGGRGYVRGDSRAFSSLPVSLADTKDSGSRDTTPGELLAAAQSSSYVVTLAALLAHGGTPPLELTVDAICQIEVDECGGTISGLHVRVRGRGAGLEPELFARCTELALECCPITRALSATVTITLEADLARGL